MLDKVLTGCAFVAGLVLLVMLVVGAWMFALAMPGVGDIIRVIDW